MATLGRRLPTDSSYEDTFKFLTWEQFPAIMNQSIRFFGVLPETGIYRHVNQEIRPFEQALLSTTGRDFTLSGVGSLIDYKKYGHNIKRPTPQLVGTGCSGASLCLEPTCFGFVEGVIENNNLLQNICWQLSMPCLKDGFYSDKQFENKMKRYFGMYFRQAPAVLEAFQRTRLLEEAVKIVATDTNIRYTGNFIGGEGGISLPFYTDPVNPLAFPDLDNLPAGVAIGGANLQAFANFLAPRLFQGSFNKGMETVKVYGLLQDYQVAKEQTYTVLDSKLQFTMQNALMSDRLDSMLGQFIHDGLFPTFKPDADNVLLPVTQEILEPATIAGFVQTSNPEHTLAPYRALLFVPNNWRWDLVSPPKDDFSDIGLGSALNFRTNTPGVFPIMSSSMFARQTIGEDGVVILGLAPSASGMMAQTATGLRPRERALQEAVRTEVMLTYTSAECGATIAGQLPNVGPQVVHQSRADGFMLKSTMYLGSDVRGTARPVLLIFKTDTPRSAVPIVVCTEVEVEIDQAAGLGIKDCCPGNQIYAVLTMTAPVGSAFAVGNSAVYRTGPRGVSFLVTVTAVSGDVITIEATNGTSILPCCQGAKDDYGTQGELVLITGTTNTTSPIMKALADDDTDNIAIELYLPVIGKSDDALGTITLADGQEIEVKLVGNTAAGVGFIFEPGDTETCVFADLDCSCLVDAVFAWNP